MIGWKQIDDFTYDDCLDYMNRTPEDERDPEIEERCNTLKKQLVEADDELFRQCQTTPEGCRRYLASNMGEGTTSYTLRHIDEANGILAMHLKQRRSRRKKRLLTFFAIFLAIAAIVVFVNYKSPKLPDCASEVNISNYGERLNIPMICNGSEWSVTKDPAASWLAIERRNDTLIVAALTNHGAERRASLTITVHGRLFGKNFNSDTKTITVVQGAGKATYLNIEPEKLSFDKYGKPIGPSTFTIKSDGVPDDYEFYDPLFKDSKKVSTDQQAKNVPYDINISDGKGTVTIGKNSGGRQEYRHTIATGGMKKDVVIEQQSGLASRLSVDRTSITVPEDGGVYNINVNTDGTSFSTTGPSWTSCTLNPDNISLHVYSTDEMRSGTLTVRSNNGHSSSISISQKGNPSSFAANTSSIHAGESSGSRTISIDNNSDKSLEVSTDCGWLHASASGPRSVTVRWDSNSSSPHYGYVTVRCGNKSTSIRVAQDGWEDCSKCRGKGYTNTKSCPNGTNHDPWGSWYYYYDIFGHHYLAIGFSSQPCATCNGSGKIKETCSKCNGNKKIHKSADY